MEKKLLFVRTRPLESNTSSSIRAQSTVELLHKCGYSITVLTTDVDYSGEDIKNPAIEKTIRIKMNGSYNYVRGAGKGKKKAGFLGTIVKTAKRIYRNFVVVDPLKMSVSKIDSVMEQLESHYDVIASCSDPKSSHLLAQEVLKRGIKCDSFIEFWGDPLLLDITRKFFLPRCTVRKIEEGLLEGADSIYYVSPYTLQAQQSLFPLKAGKMRCLLPSYQKERLSEPVTKISRIGYFGDYFSAIRNLKPLYDAVSETDYSLEIYGQSDIQLEEKQNIHLHGRVQREVITKIEDQSDLLICLCNSSGTQIPGKIYQYASTNKPILVIRDGDIDIEQFFGKYNRFIFCENNTESIIKTLNSIHNQDFSDLKPVKEFSINYQIPTLKEELG